MRACTRTVALAALVSAAIAVLVEPALGTPGPPTTIAALGSGLSGGPNSWSTSADPAVNSHRFRLERLAHQRMQSFTFATSRLRTVGDLEPQIRQALAHPTRYLTLDVGMGDLCRGTSQKIFRVRLARMLARLTRPTLSEVRPHGRSILVVSIPNLARQWRALRADPAAAAALKAGSQLDCGLGYNVTPARLEQIRRRTIALNDAIARACFSARSCLYDTGIRFRMPPRASYFSPSDFRILSVAGQRALAQAEWRPAQLLFG